MIPSGTRSPAPRPFSQFERPVLTPARGGPMTRTAIIPVIRLATKGMTTTGMTPRTPLGTFRVASHLAT
jgi:hypothetical protein